MTLHDIEIKPEGKAGYDDLTLDLTAKTYRYLDADEMSSAEAGKKKDAHR